MKALVVTLLCFVSFVDSAEYIIPSEEYRLLENTYLAKEKNEAIKPCGKYLVVTQTTKGKLVSFVSESVKTETAGPTVSVEIIKFIGGGYSHLLKVTINDEREIPTAILFYSNEGGRVNFVLEMNTRDLLASPCLGTDI